MDGRLIRTNIKSIQIQILYFKIWNFQIKHQILLRFDRYLTKISYWELTDIWQRFDDYFDQDLKHWTVWMEVSFKRFLLSVTNTFPLEINRSEDADVPGIDR